MTRPSQPISRGAMILRPLQSRGKPAQPRIRPTMGFPGVEPITRSDFPKRFIILALPRTGSTSLMHAIAAHPGLTCLNEPFNEHNYGGRFAAAVTTVESLSPIMNRIWRHYSGIKHVWKGSGWPFLGGAAYNHYLASETPDVVIVLERKNVLQRAVSCLMSEQTGQWSEISAKGRELHRAHRYRPLRHEDVAAMMHREREEIGAFGDVLRQAGRSTITVSYEDLFEGTSESRGATLGQVLSFVLDEPAHRESLERCLYVLTNRQMKLNDVATYRRIPNIELIERDFGSSETGWLFRESTGP